MQNLYEAAYACLMETDLERKLACATQLYADWQAGKLLREDTLACPVQPVAIPGRPAKPELVHPKQVKQRKLSTPEGRSALLHAVTHIEFNAINLGLDAVYRFRDMPYAYYGDWLQVAAEEAYHFNLLRGRLADLGCTYGDLPAHNGLWEQACKTDYDVMVRMALVPRVLEARGLDVTPGMMERLREVGDDQTVSVLEIILREEIGHVRIGSRWFHYCCEQRGLEADATFRQLVCEVMHAPLRGPFFMEARLQAGFSAEELEKLLEIGQDCGNSRT
ncbi:MAG: ferritin-like domain-containing protein [Thiothrix sp.]|uniref:ferritin-like domain-containing protein n=1 Tax=Thiothrix sp. TaxID=1032 RepID=UPI002637BE1F|nr:ferritin-like domain-containing protein [Thiothrix sp.]MDD5394699.1 ferritin-like domain-containing protein [Thiothrix sp.]